ncbi:MAG: glycosyltransferase family 39 protein [Anaerolineae bacterium]|nr:glycosyltransferase family 39 protein [Anaerolineae bacterium]
MKNHPLPLAPLTRAQKALLAAILLLALIVRLWGIDFGLPYVYHPDEPNYVRMVVTMIQSGDLNPHFFNFPSFLFYANALAYQPYYWIGKLVGAFESTEDITAPQMNAMASGITETPGTFIVGRMVTLLLGLITVWLVYLAARALTGNTWTALLATLFAAISPTGAMHSHFITPDIPQVFWVMLAFWGAVKIYRQGGWQHYLVAGLAVGAAASTKYHGVLVLVAVLLAHLMRYGNDMNALFAPKLYLALTASAVAFFTITPYALLDFAAFERGVTYEGKHYAQGHLGMEGNTFSWCLAYLWRIEGPLVILALLEIVRGITVRRAKETLLLAAFPITFYLFINCFTIRNDRTLLPVLPFVAILAASWLMARFQERPPRADSFVSLGVTALLLVLSIVLPAAGLIKTDFYLYYPDSAIINRTAWLPALWFLIGLLILLAAQTLLMVRQENPAWRSSGLIATGLIGLTALALPLAQTVKANLELTATDSRETARVWILENLPGGARIAVESYAPYVDPMRFWVEGQGRMIEHDPKWYLDRDFEYLVFSQRMFMRFYRDPEMYRKQIEQYDRLFEHFELLKTLTDGEYEVRIYKTGIYD